MDLAALMQRPVITIAADTPLRQRPDGTAGHPQRIDRLSARKT